MCVWQCGCVYVCGAGVVLFVLLGHGFFVNHARLCADVRVSDACVRQGHSFPWDGHDVLVMSVWAKASSGEEVCLGNAAVSLFKLVVGTPCVEIVDLKPSWRDDPQPARDYGGLVVQLDYTASDGEAAAAQPATQ